jgi:hypothetical protein
MLSFFPGDTHHDLIHDIIVLAVVAFFVLFAASKAGGFVKLLGNVLGYLFLIGVALLIAAVVTAPLVMK